MRLEMAAEYINKLGKICPRRSCAKLDIAGQVEKMSSSPDGWQTMTDRPRLAASAQRQINPLPDHPEVRGHIPELPGLNS